jgi:hypothetical protein
MDVKPVSKSREFGRTSTEIELSRRIPVTSVRSRPRISVSELESISFSTSIVKHWHCGFKRGSFNPGALAQNLDRQNDLI